MAASLLTLTSDRIRVVYPIGPFMLSSSGMMMAKLTVDQFPFKMLKPFQPIVWVCFIVSIFAAGLAMYCLNASSPFSAWNLGLSGASSDEVTWYENIWSVVGCYFNQGKLIVSIE